MNGEILGTRTPGGDSGIMSGAQMPAGLQAQMAGGTAVRRTRIQR